MTTSTDELRRLQAERERTLTFIAQRGRQGRITERVQLGGSMPTMRVLHPLIVEDLIELADAWLLKDGQRVEEVVGTVWRLHSMQAQFNSSAMRTLMRWISLSGIRETRHWYSHVPSEMTATALEEVMSCVLSKADSGRYPYLSAAIGRTGSALRATVWRTFIFRHQGPKALEAVRQRVAASDSTLPPLVREMLALKAGQEVLLNQVYPQTTKHLDEQDSFTFEKTGGGRWLTTVVDPRRPEFNRRIEINSKLPETWEWEALELAFTNNSAFETLASLILLLANKHGSLFEIVRDKHRKRGRRSANYIRLDAKAIESISQYVDMWVELAQGKGPMFCKPERTGFLLTPSGMLSGSGSDEGAWPYRRTEDGEREPLMTRPLGTSAEREMYMQACVPFLPTRLAGLPMQEITERVEEGGVTKDNITLAVAKRANHAQVVRIYFPLNMDFRGRMVHQSTYWSPLVGDLGKALLRAEHHISEDWEPDDLTLKIMYASIRGLTGVDDKKPLPDNITWESLSAYVEEIKEWTEVDDPYQIMTLDIYHPGQLYPVDGTCNGLQHLSALTLDKDCGESVNLSARMPLESSQTPVQSVLGSAPRDIYLEAGTRLGAILEDCITKGKGKGWMYRLKAAGVDLASRKLMKPCVMVIPYGVTTEGIVDTVYTYLTTTYYPQLDPSVYCTPHPFMIEEEKERLDYTAMASRELCYHPLFKQDVRKLGRFIYTWLYNEVIKGGAGVKEVLTAFAQAAGDRAVAWKVRPEDDGLCVYAGKSKKGTRGRLVNPAGMNFGSLYQRLVSFQISKSEERALADAQVDKSKQTLGIMPNFIHSHDADHMLRVSTRMIEKGYPFTAVHDCFMTTKDGLRELYHAARETFVEKYSRDSDQHPFNQQVFWVPVEGGVDTEAKSWDNFYAAVEDVLGQDALDLLTVGTLDINDTRDNFWFFS